MYVTVTHHVLVLFSICMAVNTELQYSYLVSLLSVTASADLNAELYT